MAPLNARRGGRYEIPETNRCRRVWCRVGRGGLPNRTPQGSNIQIGVLLPLTGPFAKNGIENWEAMQIARDMFNERGGVNGRKIEYLQGDATSPNAAISETERLMMLSAP